MINKGKTIRGFVYNKFTDRNNIPCSIQKSSIATENCIWLGVDNVQPKILAQDAIKLGLKERENNDNDWGWIEYKVPKEVLFNDRMHLTQDMVKELLPLLQKFAETGEL